MTQEVKSFHISRREFLTMTGLAGATLAMPGCVSVPRAVSAKDKLNIACVGVGGKGESDVYGVSGENLVAFCDVDDHNAARTYNRYPKVPRFRDYRVMFDKLGKHIDAVTVTTPDHMHYPIALEAIRRGKHVYVQKPLVQTMEQARKLLKAARRHKVQTQMGNQGHSMEGIRRVYEWVRGGEMGVIKEVACWTNRPIWPQGMKTLPPGMPVPSTLDWKLWQGGVTNNPYNSCYLPFKWRGWRAYGTGALGDMACHIMDAAVWSLDLGGPAKITAIKTEGDSPVAYPTSSIVVYEFPESNGRPALKLTWYDGSFRPERFEGLEAGRGMGDGDGGSCFIGEKASLMTGCYASSPRIFPETKMQELAPKLQAKTVKRINGGHYQDWINACKGGDPACSNFEFAVPLTEVVLLGSIAQRLPGQTLVWDGKDEFIGNKAANHLMSHSAPDL